MAITRHVAKEFDVVEMLDPVGRWPAGTSGAIVDESRDWKQIEISDEQGQMVDLISVPGHRLRLIAKHSEVQ